ncbi:MAG: hypothetical protein AAGG07_14620 [Planctomycetota bacterium]
MDRPTLSAVLALLCGLSAAALTACSSGGGSEPFRPVEVAPDQAALYIYRADRSFDGPPVRVRVDQEDVGQLRAGEHLALVVEPGERLISAEGRGSAARAVRVLDGKAAFIEIVASGFEDFVAIDLPTPEQAQRVIARTDRAE